MSQLVLSPRLTALRLRPRHCFIGFVWLIFYRLGFDDIFIQVLDFMGIFTQVFMGIVHRSLWDFYTGFWVLCHLLNESILDIFVHV